MFEDAAVEPLIVVGCALCVHFVQVEGINRHAAAVAVGIWYTLTIGSVQVPRSWQALEFVTREQRGGYIEPQHAHAPARTPALRMRASSCCSCCSHLCSSAQVAAYDPRAGGRLGAGARATVAATAEDGDSEW